MSGSLPRQLAMVVWRSVPSSLRKLSPATRAKKWRTAGSLPQRTGVREVPWLRSPE
jgi:hypothetical protein